MSKNILITGCSSGLGLALTNYYLEKNYKVFGIGRNKPDIKNQNFSFYSFDLSNTSLIKKELNDFIISIGNIDTVYLNAGRLGEIKELNKLAIEEIQKVYVLNVYANKELLDILANTNTKNIIALSSGASKNGSKGWASYSLSKAGLNMLVNLYSKELINTKILAVAPGVIQTPMTDYIRHEIDDNIFTSAKVLKAGVIQKPSEAAQRLDNFLTRIDDFESGSFIDVRQI
ncbi:SDR family NAD(P)-dependent oxidoreductase [Poseidonibacter lekithochrous]|uniref:SDR family NAD(P)-dependent oxidoreductase n=1 Tax=Poseidonibacter TaxID=2321187 RepID=UPI001C080DFC|nr:MULTISPECIES: SDR family NAD(P)-dependent oxidoreductase [Poseidonibacter]MBU3013659.1 SDR family NAD(P)-dependent oxidoreductase [Poseidonibacter lekithochrous]MDO6826956.1 SDR family NAD(P)-dependent oxidoreductase [Poseidonibacter sp. 1_MG-2023]